MVGTVPLSFTWVKRLELSRDDGEDVAVVTLGGNIVDSRYIINIVSH